MASTVRIVINHEAIAALLKSPEMLADLEQRARRIANAAGPGHEVELFTGRARARATVRTATWPARYFEATEHTLTRAIDAGR